MKFQVVMEEQAALDITAYGQWIVAQGSPLNAARWVDGIEEAIQPLSTMPKRHSVAPEARMFSPSTS